MQDRKGEVVRNDIGLESTGNRMDRSKSSLNSNSHYLEAEADCIWKTWLLSLTPFPGDLLKLTPLSKKRSYQQQWAHTWTVVWKHPKSVRTYRNSMCAPSEIKAKMWGNISLQRLCEEINNIYNEVVHLRRNIFNLLSGRAGEHFIEELTFWLKQFNSNSDLNSVALKAFMVLPSVILQKPSATFKSKEHSVAIERRLALWRQGDF